MCTSKDLTHTFVTYSFKEARNTNYNTFCSRRDFCFPVSDCFGKSTSLKIRWCVSGPPHQMLCLYKKLTRCLVIHVCVFKLKRPGETTEKGQGKRSGELGRLEFQAARLAKIGMRTGGPVRGIPQRGRRTVLKTNAAERGTRQAARLTDQTARLSSASHAFLSPNAGPTSLLQHNIILY